MAGEIDANIAKGRMIRQIDKMLGPDDKQLACKRYMLETPEPENSLLRFARITPVAGGSGEATYFTAAEAQHMARFWYNDSPPAFWPRSEKKREIVTHTYLKALKLATEDEDGIDLPAEKCLPVVTYWLCAGHQFQGVVAKSANEVTVMLLTPGRPDMLFRSSHRVLENIWVVCTKRDADDILKGQEFDADFKEVDEVHHLAEPMDGTGDDGTSGTVDSRIRIVQLAGDADGSGVVTNLAYEVVPNP